MKIETFLYYNFPYIQTRGGATMSNSKEKGTEKKKNPRFWKLVGKEGAGVSGETKWERRPWWRWTRGLGITALIGTIGVTGSYFAGDPLEIKELFKREEIVEKESANIHTGKVDAASKRYFSMGGLEYAVREEFDATTLKDRNIEVKFYDSNLYLGLRVAKRIIREDEEGNKEQVYIMKDFLVNIADYVTEDDKKTFPQLTNIKYDNKNYWEKFDKGKIIGKINLEENYIDVIQNGDVVGKVLVDKDNITNYAMLHLEKLKDEEQIIFYIEVGKTVDWGQRQRTKELFKADIVDVEKLPEPTIE